MKTTKFSLMLCIALISTVLFTACSDEIAQQSQGEVTFSMTDAPSDDAQVEGVFVTVAEIKMDGKVVGDFQANQTIDLMAYQNGNVKSIGTYKLDASAYTTLTLVLNTETDANGEAPGCYVKKTDGTKVSLGANGQTRKEITITKNVDVAAEARTEVVIDFDLRKAIKYADNQQKDSWEFVTDNELTAAIRVREKEASGRITGKIDGSNNYDKMLVFCYKRGEFDENTETQAQGESNIRFKNCETSAEVDASGNFTLAFLEAGTYEIHVEGYNENQSTGEMEAQARLSLESSIGAVIFDNSIDVSANSSTQLNLKL